MSKVKFTNPPLIEIACVVEFEKLVDFSSVHFGLYWETIKDKFTETVDENPIFYENEESSLIPLGRVDFISENKSKFILTYCLKVFKVALLPIVRLGSKKSLNYFNT